MVKTKRVYEPPETEDGLRVLVMRMWPRGIKKGSVDLWLKDLGAAVPDIKAWKAGKLDWAEMRRRYVAGLRHPAAATALARLRTLAAQRTLTLLCSCEDEGRCHRGILRSLLRRSAPSSSSGRRPPRPRAGDRRAAPAD